MRAICEICGEFYAEISLEGTKGTPETPAIDALKSPLRGAMFGSQDPHHGFPPPFHPAAEWEFMFCPYSKGTHRPFATVEEPKQIFTHKGMIDIPRERPLTVSVNELQVPVRDGSPQMIVGGDKVTVVDPKNFTRMAPVKAPKPAAKKKGK